MDTKLKFASQSPLSSGWSSTDLMRATAIDQEITKILELSEVKTTAFPVDANDIQAIVVMKRNTFFQFEWRVYAFRNHTQLVIWSVVEEAKAFQRAGFDIEVYVFEHEMKGAWKTSNNSVHRLVPQSFDDFQKIQQTLLFYMRR